MITSDLFSIITTFKNKEPPIDVYGLIQALEIERIERSLDEGISGTIERESNGKYLIFINCRDSETRKRFTAAHELGHYVYHREHIDKQRIADNRLYRSTNASKYNTDIGLPEEAHANQFAANLLMPIEQIHKFKEEGLNADKMAEKFNVSKAAMKIRYDAIFNNTQRI